MQNGVPQASLDNVRSLYFQMLPAVTGRGGPAHFFERPDEMAVIPKSHLLRDVGDGLAGRFEQLARRVDTADEDILSRGHFERVRERMFEPAEREVD